MSEEKIELTAIIKPNIRNPFQKLVFNAVLGTQFDQFSWDGNSFTKESIIRMFQNITRVKFINFGISSKNTQVMHSIQELFVSKAAIDEIEIIAKSSSETEVTYVAPINYQIKQADNTTLASLKLPGTKIVRIVPIKDFEGQLIYQVDFSLNRGASLEVY